MTIWLSDTAPTALNATGSLLDGTYIEYYGNYLEDNFSLFESSQAAYFPVLTCPPFLPCLIRYRPPTACSPNKPHYSRYLKLPHWLQLIPFCRGGGVAGNLPWRMGFVYSSWIFTDAVCR
jgi:hypothetical protein